MSMIFLCDFSIGSVAVAGGVVGGIGLIIGLLLGIAAKKLTVTTDERVEKIRECLRGSNCGGCGYTGCDGLAQAIASGEAPIDACQGSDITGIAAIMGVDAVQTVKMVARVKCNGTCDAVSVKYRYMGIADCRKLALIPGHGEKECTSGCMGYGSCVRACEKGAISIVNGIARVNPVKCIGCGACVNVCPNSLIELRPADAMYGVACNSHEKGKIVRMQCEKGCIGCGICAKQCESGAIEVIDNLARIDYDKCTGCGKCAQKCPRNIIRTLIRTE